MAIAAADLPSIRAVIVAVPIPTAVTIPPAETVATPTALELQVGTRPGSVFPAASWAVAPKVPDSPTKSATDAGATTTEATGTADTVTTAVPDLPSLVAVIVMLPGANAVTRPAADTVATDGFDDPQITERPVRVPPVPSLGTAESAKVVPTTTLLELGETTTEATGAAVTVTVEIAERPSIVTSILAVPTPIPVTTPAPETVATAGAVVDQLAGRPARELPPASLAVATIVRVAPISNETDVGVTTTDHTGTTDTVIDEVPRTPSEVAVTMAVPGATAVTRPVPDTVATAGVPEPHRTERPASGAPPASFGAAVSWAVAPTVSDDAAGDTVTEATGARLTVTIADPVRPSIVARITAEPAATAVTNPVPETVATAGVKLNQAAARPTKAPPEASRATGVMAPV